MIRNIIALLLIILPIDTFIFRIFLDNSYLYFLGYAPVIIGCIIYMLDFNKKSLIKKILTILAIISMLISLLAIGYGYASNLNSLKVFLATIFWACGKYLYKLIAIVLLVIDNKKYFFKNFWGSVLSGIVMFYAIALLSNYII